jgi:hypothetical protein
MVQLLKRRLLPRSKPWELSAVRGVLGLKLPFFILLAQVAPSDGLEVTLPVGVVTAVVSSTKVTPSNVHPSNSALRPMGMRTFLKVMPLKTGRR